ncbi:hydrolase [Longispora fulva]|uniref:Lysophospholipase L1-like esterase n=1 Tax=Longispora fulva TaxID=619741 RepID=A0A8J7GFM5_9ACTN|nr:GDSL-type esterase/lipase family protein [Longispora fulva]MBG6136901.1 lysophospholipase L1-like esterase [Longispora fulva]GIG60072.1 hydrolase [Longispora fulva]
MHTHPDAVTVLCFGDSNTFGQRAEDVDKGRWPIDVRWTGLLQNLLGDGYSVIEEGLNGRTTDLDYPDRVGRNGRAYLVPCLESHQPVDVLVLWLGGNDLKPQFGRSAADIAAALGRLIDDVESTVTYRPDRPTRILLLGPTPVDPTRPDFFAFVPPEFAPGLVAKAEELRAAVRALAAERGVGYADVGTVAGVGDDGMHLSRDAHPVVAALVAGAVTDLFAQV